MRHRFLLFVVPLLLACGPSQPEPRAGTNVAADTDAAKKLHALFDEAWEFDMKEWPTWASELGDLRYNDLWDDPSPTANARREAHDHDVLARAKQIDASALSAQDQLSYELFRRKYELAVEGERFHMNVLVLDQRNGVQTQDDLADSLKFDSVKSFEDWNARLESLPTLMTHTIEALQEGIRLGIVHPKIVMQRIPAQIDNQIVTDPQKSPFYAPYKKANASGASIPEATRARLAARAAELITTRVVPAYKSLRDFFVTTYLPACKDDVGVWALPNGVDRYAYAVRSHTTTNMTPEEVHALGLREVLRIHGEMDAVKNRAGFSGSMKDFFAFLRTDKRFFKPNGEELIEAYRAIGKRIDPQLPKLFGKLPHTPYDVEAIPDNVAPDTTTAYYREPSADGSRGGTFFVNLYKPETRPTWEMTALTLHESVPGHHIQIALANESTGIPAFRKHGEYTAFVEGWALYAESLGDEVGMYDDPYAKFGQLTYEMWRAVRLVVDTGMHSMKWTRKQAIDYFMENAAKQELDVTNEIDRYIVWPGQALAYKIGELTIKDLRKKQAQKLGDKFDERAFHDAILENGALPMDVLTARFAATH